jgi:CheY-like chemotaxis protein
MPGQVREDPPNILIVEDDQVIAHHLEGCLNELGYRVAGHANRGEDAINLVESIRPTLVLMDIMLGGDLDGIQTASEMCKRLVIPVIYLTAYADPKTLERAIATNPYGYITKPFTLHTLQSTIQIALGRQQIEREVVSVSRFPDENPYPVMRVDQDGKVIFANRSSIPLLNAWGSTPGGPIPQAWMGWLVESLSGTTHVKDIPCGEKIFAGTWTHIPGANYVNLYCFDITEQRHLEAGQRASDERIHASEQRLRTVVSNLPVIVFTIDRDGIFQLSEGLALSQLGLKPGQVVGLSVFEVYRNDPEICENIRYVLQGHRLDTTVQVNGRLYQTH